MSKMKFYPTNSNDCVDVNSSQDIKEYMGEIGESLNSIEVLEGGLVIGHIAEQGITLGRVKK